MLRNTLVKQWRERVIDRGSCSEWNRGGKQVCLRCSNSDLREAGRNENCWKHGIDNQRAWENMTGDDDCYRRQSEWSCNFWPWGTWEIWGWWWYRAGQAKQRWQTRLGGGYNLQNGTPGHGGIPAEADEAWRIDMAGMRGCGPHLPWERLEVQHDSIQGSSSCWTANGWNCSRSCTDIIWRTYGVSWYHPHNIANIATEPPNQGVVIWG